MVARPQAMPYAEEHEGDDHGGLLTAEELQSLVHIPVRTRGSKVNEDRIDPGSIPGVLEHFRV